MFEWLVELLKNELLYPVTIPAILVVIVIIVGAFIESKKLLGSIASAGLLATLYFEIIHLPDVLSQAHVFPTGFPPGSASEFVVDGLSLIVATIFTFVGFAVSVYSIGYMGDERIYEYYVLLVFMILGLNGVALAGDLVTLFVFYELLGIASYLLVAFYRNKEAIEAAIKYLIMGGTGAAFILIGMAILYGVTGTLNLRMLADAVREAGNVPQLYIAIVFFLVGFGVKAALVPMHLWLPDAHPAAPSGISAMLSGVVIKAGMYALIKTLVVCFYGASSVFVWDQRLITLFLVIAAITITVPNFGALVQRDIKRMLAYSSIYNMGIIFAAVAVGTKLAIAAAIFHLLNHALAKALLFMGSGAYINSLEHSRILDDYKGVGYSMPVTSTMFVVGSLSLAAFPPLGGFWSKFLVIWAAAVAGWNGNWVGYAVAVIIAVNSVVAIGYYFAVLVKTIWLTPKAEMSEKAKKAREAPATVLVGMGIVFAALLAVSVLPFAFFDYIAKGVNVFLSTYT